MSWKHIAIAKDKPSFTEASYPEPIAKPSGRLCIAKPILTIIPVFNNLSFAVLAFFENFLSTYMSHIIIIIIPSKIPINEINRFEISSASGISSKQITAIISPAANDNIKLKNLLEVLFNFTPIIPPIVVPKVPKNRPTKVVLTISFIVITYFY